MLLPIPQPNAFNRLAMEIVRIGPITRLLAQAYPDRRPLRRPDYRRPDHGHEPVLRVARHRPDHDRRKSGQPRQVPLLVGVDGDRLILFATNFGGEKNPAWYYNLTAHPAVTVTYKNRSAPYTARPASAAEKEHYWPLADAMYPGYANYRQRASHRDIPVVVLTPGADHSDAETFALKPSWKLQASRKVVTARSRAAGG